MQENFDVNIYQAIVQYLLEQGCELTDIEELVKICPKIFQMDIDSFEKKVTILFNANIFYGLIICNKNDFQYYLVHQQTEKQQDKTIDYVVKTIIDGTKKQYLQKITGISPDDDLETKLFKMKQLKFNSSGYQVK